MMVESLKHIIPTCLHCNSKNLKFLVFVNGKNTEEDANQVPTLHCRKITERRIFQPEYTETE